MFDLLRKKRIEQYVQDANGYLTHTYEPELPPKKEFADMRSSCQTDTGIKYSSRREPQYSFSAADSIPKQGDKFRKDTVKQLFAQYSMNNGKLNQQLDITLNLTFVDMLTRYIQMKGWRDSKVYKAAQIDRRLFSKIMSDREYKPAKDTAVALAIALELTLQQTTDLLDRAGYTLSHSNKRDVIIEYFIREDIHNLGDINDVLYKLDQKPIGR